MVEEAFLRLVDERSITSDCAKVKLAREIFDVANALETIRPDALIGRWRNPAKCDRHRSLTRARGRLGA